MKSIVLALFVLFSGSLFAKEVSFTCQPKAFFCNNGHCSWRLQFAPERIVTMDLDPRYPNPSYPHEVWRGYYQTEKDRHILNLAITFTEADGISTTASLQQGSVFSETSGGAWIDVSLRTFDYGRGFICSGFTVEEYDRP